MWNKKENTFYFACLRWLIMLYGLISYDEIVQQMRNIGPKHEKYDKRMTLKTDDKGRGML